ncbi:immunoglobulin-like domain-containing protein [Listeria innocua]
MDKKKKILIGTLIPAVIIAGGISSYALWDNQTSQPVNEVAEKLKDDDSNKKITPKISKKVKDKLNESEQNQLKTVIGESNGDIAFSLPEAELTGDEKQQLHSILSEGKTPAVLAAAEKNINDNDIGSKIIPVDVANTPAYINPSENETINPDDGISDNDSSTPVTPPDSNIAPTLTAEEQTLHVYSNFDPLEGVTAVDAEDGDLTSSIIVISNNVNMSIPGTYNVTYSVKDSNGAKTILSMNVNVVNDAPSLIVSEKTIHVKDSFNPLIGVTAVDLEDGDLTKEIKVIENTVDTSKEGTYSVTYEVTDAVGGKTQKSISVAVVNDAPIISTDDKNKNIPIDSEFNALDEVTAYDTEDGDLTKEIKVIENTVDTSKEGIYSVTYEVTDSYGKTTSKTIKVSVLNEAPEISAKDKTIKINSNFDPLEGITAKDNEDGDITGHLTVKENTVDTAKEGIYKVIYSVKDKNGKESLKEIVITVEN